MNVEKILAEKRWANRTADSTFERIYKHHHDTKSRVELDATEQKICERWNKAWILLCTPKTLKSASEDLIGLFGITLALAFDDCRNAMMLFGDPRLNAREQKRAIAEEIALRKMQAAEERKDYEMSERYFNRWLEISGLKEHFADNGLAEMIKNFKPHQIVMNFSKEQVQKSAQQLLDQLTQDISHEEIQ